MGDPTITQLADHRKKRFSDFADEPTPLDGDKVKLDDILNQEIELTGYRVKKSRYSKNQSGEYLTIQLRYDGKTLVCFTGSDVLINQLKRYGDEIPFLTTIKKINRYYTLG